MPRPAYVRMYVCACIRAYVRTCAYESIGLTRYETGIQKNAYIDFLAENAESEVRIASDHVKESFLKSS